MAEKVLIITGDGGESYEALYACHRLMEANYEPVVAAPSKRRLHLVMHDFEPGWDTYVERPGYGLESQQTFTDVSSEEYVAVLILGGRAPEYLRNNSDVIDLVREFEAREKWIFAICHGIQILVAAGLVKGRTVTCYEHVRHEVESCGGAYSTDEAVRDERMITAQTWQSHPDFYRAIFRALSE